jgi:hydrogenase nickel incorporation protein HypA/HybF
MHELAIAEALVAIAECHARGRRVTRVEVEVGHLRQVVPAALEFAFELVARDTAVEGAQLVLRAVPVSGLCRDCGERTGMPTLPLACAACGSVDVEIVTGEELRVDALELEEMAATTGGTGHGG